MKSAEQLINEWLSALLLDEDREAYQQLTEAQKLLVLKALRFNPNNGKNSAHGEAQS